MGLSEVLGLPPGSETKNFQSNKKETRPRDTLWPKDTLKQGGTAPELAGITDVARRKLG